MGEKEEGEKEIVKDGELRIGRVGEKKNIIRKIREEQRRLLNFHVRP